MRCREILFTPRCSPRAKEFPGSGQLFSTTYSCGATGRQHCPIFGFWPIFPIPLKRTFWWPAYRGYIADWLRFFCLVVEGPNGCLPQRSFPATSGRGAGEPPNLPKVSPIANGYTHTEFYYTAREIWTKDVW